MSVTHALGVLRVLRRPGRTAAAFRATRPADDVPVGRVWPEQWLTLYRLLTR